MAASAVTDRLPRVGIGTVPLGNLYETVSDAAAESTLQAAWSAGVRWFDTAPVYGMGLAERRLGHALRAWPREEFVLSSKVGRVLEKGAPPDAALQPGGRPFFVTDGESNPRFDFSPAGIDRSLTDSLERLGVDHLDIAFVHDPEDYADQVVAETIPHLVELRDAGMIRAIGVGMTRTEVLTDIVTRAPLDLVMIAGRYTLLDAGAGGELFPACLDAEVPVVVGGVFNSGVLAGGTDTFDYVGAPAEILERVQRIREVCEGFDVPLPSAAIAFALGHPAVRSVVLGVRSEREVRDNLRFTQTHVPGALWHELQHRGLIPNDAEVVEP